MAGADFRDYFRPQAVNGVPAVVCTLCSRMMPKNLGSMRTHYVWTHGSVKPTSPCSSEVSFQQHQGSVTQPADAPACSTPPTATDDPVDEDICNDDTASDEGSNDDTSSEDSTTLNKRGKNIINYLAVCPGPSTYMNTIKSAPDEVIDTICKAAQSVRCDKRVVLSAAQKKLFRQNASAIEKIAKDNDSTLHKRKILSQRGGFSFVPALIEAALHGLGSLLFGQQG